VDIKVALGLLARHLLTTAGGMLVAKEWIDASQVEPAAGALLILGGIVWSVIQKKRVTK
jgi:hypothetical protein